MNRSTQTDDDPSSNSEGPHSIVGPPNPETPDDGHPSDEEEETLDGPSSSGPRPSSKSNKKKKALIIGGIVGGSIITAVGAAVAAPVVIPAAVTVLGFEAGGILAGSTAAWLMSLGGGVTPVAVSVMQSIGATGLISAATAAGAGAAVGGATVAGATAVVVATNRENKSDKATQTD